MKTNRLVDWKLTENEKKIIVDALDGGSFFEEANGYALGWTGPETTGLSKEAFLSALRSMKAKKYVDFNSEGEGGDRVWWVMVQNGPLTVAGRMDEPEGPLFGEGLGEEVVHEAKSNTYSSLEDKISYGDIISGLVVVHIPGRKVYGLLDEETRELVTTTGFWTNRSTVIKKVEKIRNGK